MTTAAVHPEVLPAQREQFRRFLGVCLALAALKLAIQIIGNILAQRAGYGIFRDEMYYLICGRHLAFGYVDQPPMVALQARASELLFGYDHLWAFRLLSALAGAMKVFLTGALVWAMGGSRRAAALAMLGVTVAGVYLGIDSFLSMNSFEPVFWLPCALALIRIVQLRGDPASGRAIRNWWLVLGLSAGLGLEDKVNEVFFLVAVLIALLLTPQRRILASRWFAAAIAIIVAVALPNLLWQIHYHWPTLEWLVKISHSGKDVKLAPLAFLIEQVMMLTPWTVVLWLSGVIWLLAAKRARPCLFLGVLYLVYLPLMIALHAKDYYLAPAYPIYFAAGAVCWLPAGSLSRLRRIRAGVYATLLVVGFVLTVPFSIPVLPPQSMVAWEHTMHFAPADSETHDATILPQFYADRFGWHEMVDKVARIYNALPPGEKAVTGIFTGNYGEASAINVFGPKFGLPTAISGHQNYWLWGPHGYTGEEMIVIGPPEDRALFESCAVAAQMDNPLSMPWEKKPIFLCRGRKVPYAADWKDLKNYY
ncbi:MAG TPA: glycosyltransferase family 39 protein [Acidobacteriaceae bacterium]